MSVAIDITENGIEINGAAVKLPCHVNELLSILGAARRTTFDKVRDGVFSEEETRGLNEQIRGRACYTWDSLGAHCHTEDGVTVDTLALYMCKSEVTDAPEYYPQSFFSGKLTINGAAWLKAIEKGDKGDVSTELIVGGYSVYGSRADCKSHLFSKGTKYSVVELSLDEDIDDDDDYGDLFTK